jgi:hypothetical protein
MQIFGEKKHTFLKRKLVLFNAQKRNKPEKGNKSKRAWRVAKLFNLRGYPDKIWTEWTYFT